MSADAWSHERMNAMAKKTVQEVVNDMNLDLSLKLDKVMFEVLWGLWAEWIEMGVPEDLMDTFEYTFDLVEYIHNSTFDHGGDPAHWEVRDIAQEVRLEMSIKVVDDVREDDNGKKHLVISCDEKDDVVRYARPKRPVMVTRPSYIPLGNGRYVWVLGEEFPEWTGAEACRAHLEPNADA